MPLKNIESYTSERRRFVLVVDSSERNQKFLSTLLNKFEYEAYAVSTVKEAVEIAAVISPVLIVTAKALDEGNDALTLIKSFTRANPTSTAPFIVLLAKPDPMFERDCLAAGALICLRAPVTFENFYRVIQVAIEPIPRMCLRISTNLPAAIKGTRKDECVREISENGAYIMTSVVYPLNTTLPLRIKLADSVVHADVVVLYAKQSAETEGQWGMGMQFVKISEADQLRIRAFIRSEMSRGINLAL